MPSALSTRSPGFDTGFLRHLAATPEFTFEEVLRGSAELSMSRPIRDLPATSTFMIRSLSEPVCEGASATSSCQQTMYR
jgi:hypothetical protein